MVTVYIGLVLSFMILVVPLYCVLPQTKPEVEFPKYLKSTNIQLIGRYDTVVAKSLQIWCYSVEVTFYRNNITADVHKTFLKWCEERNTDPDNILYNAIENAHTAFLETVEKARERETDPAFNVALDFELTMFGNSLRYNDYVDMNTILQTIKNMMEVSDGEEC